MSDLHPTKTRLALLHAIVDPNIKVEVAQEGPALRRSWIDDHRNITDRCNELERAGWIRLGAEIWPGKWSWELTPAGQAVLDSAAEKAAQYA